MDMKRWVNLVHLFNGAILLLLVDCKIKKTLYISKVSSVASDYSIQNEEYLSCELRVFVVES